MTIFQALARLIEKLTDYIPTRCKHQWEDKTEVSVFSQYSTGPHAKPIGQKMVQRCSRCQEFRELKIF